MCSYYLYELWNGKEVVGYYGSVSPLLGLTITVYELPILKQPYGVKAKTIICPVIFRRVDEKPYIEWTTRRCIDVRKKSKRQIAILASHR